MSFADIFPCVTLGLVFKMTYLVAIRLLANRTTPGIIRIGYSSNFLKSTVTGMAIITEFTEIKMLPLLSEMESCI